MRKSNLTNETGLQAAETAEAPAPIVFYKDEPANADHVPTPIRKAVKGLMIAYIQDESRPIPNDLNLLVQNLYLEAQGFVDEMLAIPSAPNLFSVMSRDAQRWAGLTRRDPSVPVLRFPGSKHPVIGKVLHTFSTIVPFIQFTDPENLRGSLAGLIGEMPDAEE